MTDADNFAGRKQYKLDDVKPVTFERFLISDDGEKIVFEVRDKKNNTGHISVDWLGLSRAMHLFIKAAEDASKVRRTLGKSDDFDGSAGLTAQIVSGFQVSEIPEEKLKILTLQTATGFRCDFAIPTETLDQLGRRLPRAIAEELLEDSSELRQRPI